MFTVVILLLPAQPIRASVEQDVDRRMREQSLPQRVKRRDEALRHLGNGKGALGFLQSYGDPGVEAVLRCEPYTAKGLLALHESGALARLAHPHLLILLIAQRGEEVAAWFVRHHKKLASRAALEAFLSDPFEYIHEIRALPAEPISLPAFEPAPWPGYWAYWKEGLFAAGLVALLFLGWRRWQGRAQP